VLPDPPRTTSLPGWCKTGLTALALLAVAGAWFWLKPATTRVPDPVHSNPALSRLLPMPVQVATGIYLPGESPPAAVYMVDTAEGLVLVDSGLESSADGLIDQLTRLGFDIGRLRAILLTHVHGDHSLGAERLRALTGATIYAGRGDCEPLRAAGPREAFFSIYENPGREPHATHVDVELAGDETLSFGDTRFTVIACPGHTPGSMCYLLDKGMNGEGSSAKDTTHGSPLTTRRFRALFTGDVVQHLTARGPSLGTYSAYLPPLYRGNARDYLASLRRLRELPLPDLVLPGHPQADPVPLSPHLTAESWQALLDHGIADMEKLLARYEADGANFLDGIPKELLPGLHYLGNFGGRAIYCLGNANGRFLFDAPGDDMLVAFLVRRFKERGWEERKLTAVLLTSADAEATAGLGPLVQSTGCQVVAPRAGLDTVRRLCPATARISTAEDVGKAGWFQVEAIALEGLGLAPLAYQLSWAGKIVLVSGHVPVKLSTATTSQLRRAVEASGGNREQYLQSLQRLGRLRPNLWLPAVPVHGQNANVYDADWPDVLAENGRLFR